jgi:alkyl hydroperoxide reductase subunit F
VKDILVIGAGPAGLTASIYLARRKTDFKLVSENIGGQALISSGIENYSGFLMIEGSELVDRFREHAAKFDVDMAEGVKVVSISGEEGSFISECEGSDPIRSRRILIASGAVPRKLGIPGEEEFLGRGIAYCAVCDGPVFAGKTVAVVGGGNSAVEAALQLAVICPELYVINIEKELRAEAVLADKLKSLENVNIINSSTVSSAHGDGFLRSVTVKGPSGERSLAVAGLFVEIGWRPASDFAPQPEKNRNGEIIVDRSNRTSYKGIYAAGDVTESVKKQVIIASGDGAKAALCASEGL